MGMTAMMLVHAAAPGLPAEGGTGVALMVTPGLVLGIAGMAVLFALVGLLPLAHRSCDACPGDCSSCPLDEKDEAGGRNGAHGMHERYGPTAGLPSQPKHTPAAGEE